MIIFILSIIFACSCGLNASEYSSPTIDILKTLSSISEKDRAAINSLFKDLFKFHTFAYSLYGDKPMTYCDVSLADSSLSELLEIFPIDQCCKEILEIYSEPKRLLKSKWKIWKCYQNQFQIKNYLLLDKPIGKRSRIFLINKKAFKRTINQNINLFRKIIDLEVSAEKLLTQFQSENINVFDILHHSEALLGILLGFGRDNALLFQQREDLLDKIEKLKSYGIYNLEPLQKEVQLMNSQLQSLHEYDFDIVASSNRVCFAANPAYGETIQLRNKYDKLNLIINEIYSNDNWFEQTFVQLTSE